MVASSGIVAGNKSTKRTPRHACNETAEKPAKWREAPASDRPVNTSLPLGFSDYEQVYVKKKTRWQVFLDQMEAKMPWDGFLALIRPVYHQLSAKGGRPPFPLAVMLRIHLLQPWFTLSDPLMQAMQIDAPCLRRFVWNQSCSEFP